MGQGCRRKPIMRTKFTGQFTKQIPIPEEAIEAAVAVMRSGQLHRYNSFDGELSEVSSLEQEFADFVGSQFCLAVTSGGYAMRAALWAVGVRAGDAVLTNAFTLAPVPGAIAAAQARSVFVEVTSDLVIDLDDLEAKADQASVLLLSHMRGHICDMDRLMAICTAHDITVIEDCAHTMGATWDGVPSGRHGVIGCYSTQTYKHLNSGEGGFLVTDDADIMAQAVLYSGSYMLYERHGTVPEPEVMERHIYDVPNVSGRLDNLRAAILRPQLRQLPQNCAAWRVLYQKMENAFAGSNSIQLIKRHPKEAFVGSSFQFLLPTWKGTDIQTLLKSCAARGVEIKWFGAERPTGFTSRYGHWHYAPSEPLIQSDRVLTSVLDLRLPLSFDENDCTLIASIIKEEVAIIKKSGAL